jgi:hypothetical protein
LTFSTQEHLGRYFFPPLDWFASQEHPRAVVEAQHTYQGSAQAKKHVFQDFGMFSSSYLLQG